MKILIVDDERLVRVCLESMLHELIGDAAECYHAGSAMQAEKWLASNSAPDIIFVDYKMPKKSGLELAEEQRKAGMETRWVLLSGYEMSPFQNQIADAGIRHVFLKPISIEELDSILNETATQRPLP